MAQSAASAKLRGDIERLQSQLKTYADERDQARKDAGAIAAQLNQASAALGTCHADKSNMAGQLETLSEERMALIYELYETLVTEMNLGDAIASLENQFQNDSAYQLTQKKKAKSELTRARANFHTELTDAHSRIAELETALAEKTKQAEEMIAELNRLNGGQLDHFSGKASVQAEMINGLKAQIDELRKTNKALTLRRFDDVGTDNIMGNRLIDALAKHGSIYGAFYHERQGHNGRLKVWLSLVDTSLSRAKDALEDLEAELKLWAKPSVEVSRGMHLFTLATEQEFKAEEKFDGNLNRLEKDFDGMNHIRLVGGTGSGKSTFLDNMIWLGKLLWPIAEMDLLDPKAPYTIWQGGLKPDYKNLECVEAIKNISAELQNRFKQANEIADEHGNDSPEFEAYQKALPPYLFVLDEAQYLYRMAKAEDSKDKPKTTRASIVKDSLLDCLGVGRALNVKGYFITQSAKCSKLGMNDDDFDNATSIFLNAAITNALEGELKGAFPDSKLDKISAEYAKRRAQGQAYIGMVAHADSGKIYLFQPPQPGYYHSRVLAAKAVPDPGAGAEEQTAEPAEVKGIEQGTTPAINPTVPASDPQVIQPAPIAQGTAACPSCGTFSQTIRNGAPNSLGKVKFACKSKGCDKKIFSAVPTR